MKMSEPLKTISWFVDYRIGQFPGAIAASDIFEVGIFASGLNLQKKWICRTQHRRKQILGKNHLLEEMM